MTQLERGIIPIIGRPGSGKSRLGREMEIAMLLRHDYNVEHLSLGDRVRKIGQETVWSAYTDDVINHLNDRPMELMNDELVAGILDEGIDHANETDLIFLDGVPRRATQVGMVDSLAVRTDRAVQGVIVTEAAREISLLRLQMRAVRQKRNPVDPDSIARRMKIHDQHFPEILHRYENGYPSIPLETIDTSGPKALTTERGLRAVSWMIGISLNGNKNAS